jgi:hypothetical protein
MVLSFESHEHSGKQKTSRPEGTGGERRAAESCPPYIRRREKMTNWVRDTVDISSEDTPRDTSA